MLLSRFWYLILSLALGGAVAVLFITQNFYNRQSDRWMSDALTADSSAVGWYLRDDARVRATALLPIALNAEIREGLGKASDADEVAPEIRQKVTKALRRAADENDVKFYALWAVDADGRVVGDFGWEHKAGWNIGGYSVVADALAGWIRDDAWVLKEKLYRVVARPVERDSGGEPIGAIVGLASVDDTFADAVSQRTGAAVAFYAQGTRVATGAPQDFRRADLDVIQSDLKDATVEPEYAEKGRSKVRRPREDLGLVYARMAGEAADLQAGYAVGRAIVLLNKPTAVLDKAEKQDTDKLPRLILIGIALGLGLIGIVFTILEHSRPLSAFKGDVGLLAAGKIDTFAPSRFRGAYKKIAADLNEGIEKIAVKGGAPRRAADLESVIGPIPAQPQMSAFSVPEATASTAGEARSLPKAPDRKLPPPPPGSRAKQEPDVFDDPTIAIPRPPLPIPAAKPTRPDPPAPRAQPAAAPSQANAGSPPNLPIVDGSTLSELDEWKQVFAEYVQVRKQCGEPTETLTFDKFKATLERNKAAIVERHHCSRVKFTVYVKDGKAALKAAPQK